MGRLSKKVTGLSLFQQLLVVMLIITMIPVAISGFLVYRTAEQGFEQETLQVAAQHARDWEGYVDAALEEQIANMAALGAAPAIYDACIIGATWDTPTLYASYEGAKFGSENPEEDLPEKEPKFWDPSNDPYPAASEYLERYCNIHTPYLEIFVTDVRGYNVATMTSTPGDFDQSGEVWYVDTLNDGIFTEYEFDESAGETVYTIALKLEKGGNLYGILKAAFYLPEILTEFRSISFYESGYGLTVEKHAYSIISSKDASMVGASISEYLSEDDFQIMSSLGTAHAEDAHTQGVHGEEQNGAFIGTFDGQEYFIGYASREGEPFLSMVLVPASVFTEATQTVLLTSIFVAAIALVTSFGMAMLSARFIASPISYLANVSKEIAEGDLSVQVKHYDRRDEVGQFGAAFREMVEFLRPTVTQITTIAEQLSSSAQEMASSAEEVNASGEEISSIAQQLSTGASRQTEQIDISLQQAEELQKEFDERIRGIEMASELIATIASQVNILALNASIEAARAGDYGRGFAVVADNVRRLANDTRQSLVDVNQIIGDLRGSLSESIAQIAASIQAVASISQETAASSEEASAATEEQTATMEEMTASAQELANVASDLGDLMKKFVL